MVFLRVLRRDQSRKEGRATPLFKSLHGKILGGCGR
jgi:hypothetical protein